MTNKKRTGKFYRKNEAEVMESLGLKPTKNSGSGWIEKEDCILVLIAETALYCFANYLRERFVFEQDLLSGINRYLVV